MPKALIIDDEAALTVIMARFLENAGFTVQAATSGREGLEKAMADRPDAIVVDVMMPEMDGYEVCRRLRRDPRTARAAIVVLTARGQLIDKEIALRAGADVHMAKPYQGTALVEAIRHLLNGREADEQPLGYQILVLRLSAGAGATTLATNLAAVLTKQEHTLVAIADMALRNGQVENWLGLPPTRSWSQGWSEPDDVAHHLRQHESGLFVLPAPPPQTPLPTVSEVRQGLQTLRGWHDYVVVDTPFHMGPLAPVLLAASRLVLLLLTLDSAALRTARASLQAIRKQANRTAQVWPVLNMAGPEPEATRSQVERILAQPVMAVLPSAPEACARAVQDGRPVTLAQPDSPLAVAVRELAWRIVKAPNAQPLRRIPQ
ncbi:MAG: response regulator [Anaerolineae bacterium]